VTLLLLWLFRRIVPSHCHDCFPCNNAYVRVKFLSSAIRYVTGLKVVSHPNASRTRTDHGENHGPGWGSDDEAEMEGRIGVRHQFKAIHYVTGLKCRLTPLLFSSFVPPIEHKQISERHGKQYNRCAYVKLHIVK